MLESAKKEFQKLEGTIMTNNVPRLENTASLALFYKKGVKDKVLYTNVQEEKIQYFIAENYDQMHQNTAFELLYVLSGTVINKIEDKEFIYHAGQGCLLNRRITHSDILKNGHLLVLNISEDILKEVLLPLKSTPEIQGKIFQFLLSNLQGEDDWMRSYIEFSPCAPVDNPIFRTLLDAIQLELATFKIGAEYFQKGLLLRLLTELENPNIFQLNRVDIDLNKEEFLVSRLISLIESHYGNISRKDIEKQLHYNSEYLNRLLKKQSGMTIIKYAKSIRISKAKQLLHTTNMKITDIANGLGFSSENYFYHYFKEETGLSPNQYRTQKAQEN
ncbi:two-component response regulator [Streptococcus gallolyticus]|uniref:AraC-type DNA-binding protein n=4 Tax=Streptococcus gallolyticus TaxID=315405 RepID=A0A139R5X9_9STRE|nr:AraC family transcriptional regulator [Streptococcus gallolyticus]AQP42641.1 hypothetical protein BTR42_08345 [Streptococcus gallolyticus subsp. gallolyticus DSM 16831]KXU10170.1 Two-component response regulator yesN [Streptococcus gallolyticus]SFC39659.1 AraC-type DNA-binding protein [Streptococcus gallolyticus]SFU54077.1 AraC-type DNA-binding protein [Streptococcus gallolyticus]SQG79948.1 two-component response regulator [Streptococcus gallolyticus]